VVYISKREKYYQLYLYDLVTRSETRLVNTSWDIWDPTFSDDGNKIIYSAKQKGNWDLFEFDLNSKTVKQITDTKGDEWDPFYTSDSTLIYSGSFGPFRCIYKRNLDF
jgi:TolB protein